MMNNEKKALQLHCEQTINWAKLYDQNLNFEINPDKVPAIQAAILSILETVNFYCPSVPSEEINSGAINLCPTLISCTNELCLTNLAIEYKLCKISWEHNAEL